MRNYIPSRTTPPKRIKSLISASLILIAIYLAAKLCGNLGVDIFNRNLGNSVILFYIFGFIGSLALILGSTALPQSQIIETISIGTFLILAVHLLILQLLSPIVQYFTSPIISGFIILLCIPIIYLASKWCPIALGKGKHS